MLDRDPRRAETAVAVPPSGMIASFRVFADLGEVPGGRLYRAADTRTDLAVLLKVMRAPAGAGAGARERELAETRRLTRLDREGIPAVYEVGSTEGATYVAFGEAPGRTLRRFVAEGGRVDRATLVDWACQLLDLLAEAHALGVLHRHLGADSVVVGEGGRLTLSGFGLTQTGPDAPELKAPEARQGGELAPASDLYALAALVRRLAAPAALGGAAEEPLAAADPLARVLERATLSDPRERFQDAADLAAAIREAAEPPAPEPPWPVPPTAKPLETPATFATQIIRPSQLAALRGGELSSASPAAGAAAPPEAPAEPPPEPPPAAAPPRRRRLGLWLLLFLALLLAAGAAWWLLVAQGAWPPWASLAPLTRRC